MKVAHSAVSRALTTAGGLVGPKAHQKAVQKGWWVPQKARQTALLRALQMAVEWAERKVDWTALHSAQQLADC